jgi:hypothetical protein
MASSWRWIFAAGLLVSVVGCGSKKSELTPVQEVDVAMQNPDPEIRARTLIEISVKQRAMKDTPGAATTAERALKSAQEIKAPERKAEVLVLVAQQLLAGGGSKIQANAAIDSAQVAVARIQERPAKVAATISLAEALYRIGERDTAATSLNTAQSLVDGVTVPDEKVPLLAALAAARWTTGNPQASQKLLQATRDAAAQITEPSARVRTEAAAAAVLYKARYAEEGRKLLDAAVAEARAVADPQKRTYALADIVEAMSPYRNQLPLNDLLVEASASARQVKELDQQQLLMKHLQGLVGGSK